MLQFKGVAPVAPDTYTSYLLRLYIAALFLALPGIVY